MRFGLLFALVLCLTGCLGEAPSGTRDERHRRLLSEQLARRDLQLEEPRYEGLDLEKRHNVYYSYLAPDQSQAEILRDAILAETDYQAHVVWFDEPTATWFVVGETAGLSLEQETLRRWLDEMIVMGLDYSCDLWSWSIKVENAI